MNNREYYLRQDKIESELRFVSSLNRHLADYLKEYFDERKNCRNPSSLQRAIANFWTKNYTPTLDEDIEKIKQDLILKYNLKDIKITYESEAQNDL